MCEAVILQENADKHFDSRVRPRFLLQFSVGERGGGQSREENGGEKEVNKGRALNKNQNTSVKLDAWTPGLTNRQTLRTVNTDSSTLRC